MCVTAPMFAWPTFDAYFCKAPAKPETTGGDQFLRRAFNSFFVKFQCFHFLFHVLTKFKKQFQLQNHVFLEKKFFCFPPLPALI